MPNYQAIVADTLTIEANALKLAATRLGSEIEQSIAMLLACKGKVIVTGVGKSGLVGAKIAATLASTGTPSFFMHPTEALHGDLGMIGSDDMILAISYSGESSELTTIMPHLKRLGIPIIAMSRDKEATLSTLSDIWLDISVEKEACPLGIAPTASTTLTLALGDALAMALMQARNFTKEDFASFHPGGSLGRALFVTVESLMQTTALPIVHNNTTIKEAIVVMSSGRLGTIFIVDENHALQGIVSDGDVRRALMQSDFSLDAPVYTIANTQPKTISTPQMLAIDALEMIENYKIQLLAIINENDQLIGALHLHQLIEAGIHHATK